MRPRRLVLAVLCLSVLAGCADEPAGPMPPSTPSADPALLAELQALAEAPVLVLETEMGTIRALLYTERMPVTAGRIAELADSGFYDGTLIHRVVDDFVIQGGDPTGSGEGGSGQLIPFETDPDLPFGIGALGMAQWTPGTADSQWFITEKPAPHLNAGTDDPVASRLGPYPMFGQVIGGMDVVRAISEVPVIPEWDRPIAEIRTQRAWLDTSQGVDLLQLPRALEANIALAGGTFHLEQPRTIYATHPFLVQVVVSQPPTEPATLELSFHSARGADVVVPLDPVDDGTLFEARVMLTAGDWEQTLTVAGQQATWTRAALPWQADFIRFTGQP